MSGLFDSIHMGSLELKNRIMVSPMCQYQATEDGAVTDWHLVHYGSLALGGPSLILVEATAVESRGRISVNDVGLYSDSHVSGLRQIVEFGHKQDVKMGVQLAHAGRKADLPEEIVSPTALAFSSRYKLPVELTIPDINTIIQAFAGAAQRAVEAGFDVIEIHGAHGYLAHQFLSPLSNHRVDEYGQTRQNRMRFLVEVVRAVKKTIPTEMPLLVRISASDYDPAGISMDDMIYYCQTLKAEGVSMIDVSSGGNVPVAPPLIYPGYQLPFAAQIRSAVGIPVIGVGILDDPIVADAAIQEGRIDMAAIARGFLREKHWAHHAAIALKQPVHAPTSYARAF